MRPIAIFRHLAIEGPGYLASFLDAKQIPWQLIAIDRDEPIPEDPTVFSGLVFMGGPMSVNDNLPWIPHSLSLIRQAVTVGVPVLGHCLGGQLIAKALGGIITRNPIKEIGWGAVTPSSNPLAEYWFGSVKSFQAFHWHGETFSLPEGATRILSSAHCENQAFALGKHLALQCHVEMTPAMIRDWCKAGQVEIAASTSPAVQSEEAMLSATPGLLPEMSKIADRLYSTWLAGLEM